MVEHEGVELLNQNLKRRFLFQGLASLALLSIWKNCDFFTQKGEAFYIRYGIDISGLSNIDLKNSELAYSGIIQDLCRSGLSPDWVSYETQVKQRFIQEGRLLSSKIVFEPSNRQFVILTSWRDKTSFYAYYSETQLYKLDNAFQAAGLRPRIFNSEAVFPQQAVLKWS